MPFGHALRSLAACICLGVLPALAGAAGKAPAVDPFASPESVMRWIDNYHLAPEPARVPDAVHAMSRLGLIRDLDSAGMFVGFLAGIIADNQADADKLIGKMFPLPPEDQGVIIKAIAYSGVPDWKDMLGRFVERMPARKVLIGKVLEAKFQPLFATSLETGPVILDTLWGYHLASGSFEPVQRIIGALKWSKEKKSGFQLPWTGEKIDLNKLTVGATAKWTLTAAGQREKELLDLYRMEIRHQPPDVAEPLKEVITAAENFEVARVRKEALEAIETLKRQNPAQGNAWGWWAQAGTTMLALGCVVASAAGHVEIAAPCVITGAAGSAAGKLFGQ